MDSALQTEDELEIDSLLAAGNIPEAVELVREITDWGLAKAARWVDERRGIPRPPKKKGVLLSRGTQLRLKRLFHGKELKVATELLVNQCGNDLPFCENLGPVELERFRFAVLKLSEGRLDLLRKAIDLAKADWRDLLVAAEFANDVLAHERWMPK